MKLTPDHWIGLLSWDETVIFCHSKAFIVLRDTIRGRVLPSFRRHQTKILCVIAGKPSTKFELTQAVLGWKTVIGLKDLLATSYILKTNSLFINLQTVYSQHWRWNRYALKSCDFEKSTLKQNFYFAFMKNLQNHI